MAKSWVGHNNKVFQKAIGEHKAMLEQRINRVCQELAEEIKLYIEAFDEIEGMPIFTGNLADGTGVGVYVNGALNRFMPAKKASEPQSYGDIENIWGAEYLQEALSQANGDFNKGIWVVLYSTVPYAVKVDDFGTVHNDESDSTPAGFFSEKLVIEMIEKFKVSFTKEFPQIAKQIKTTGLSFLGL